MSISQLVSAQRARVRGMYRGWWIVLLSFYTQLITVSAGGYVFGVLILSMQSELKWSQAAIVGPLLVNRWISGLLSMVLGPLVDRYGSRATMTISAAVAGLGLIAVSRANTLLMFYAAWALFGVAQPGVGLLGPRVVVANWFVRKRAQAFVIVTLGTSAAGVVAVPTAAFIDERYGWRLVWFIVGILCFSIAPLSWWLIRKRPEDVGLLPDGDEPGTLAQPATARGGPAVAADTPWTVREAVRTRSFWLLTLGFLLCSMPTSAIFINLSGFVQSYGFSKALGAGVVSTYAFGSLAARPVWGYFLERLGLHRTMVAFGAIYGSSIVLFAVQTGLIPMYITAFILGMGISGTHLLNAQALPDYFGRRIVGSLTGFTQLPNVAIAGSAPLMTALVFDRTGGYVLTFLFFAVACFVAAVAFMLAPPPVHPSERDGAGTRTPEGAASGGATTARA
ncbi:MAG: MFS transporter [Dehalococcoidia bacterium]